MIGEAVRWHGLDGSDSRFKHGVFDLSQTALDGASRMTSFTLGSDILSTKPYL